MHIARKARAAHPAGHYENGGRWYPDNDERCDCCASITSPTRAHVYSLRNHCRTLVHTTSLCRANFSEALRLSSTFNRMCDAFADEADDVFGPQLMDAAKQYGDIVLEKVIRLLTQLNRDSDVASIEYRVHHALAQAAKKAAMPQGSLELIQPKPWHIR